MLTHLQDLVQDYRKRGITLVIGSGVSKASGIPTWVDLLKEIAHDSAVCGVTRQTVDELTQAGLSLPAIAAYLRQSHDPSANNGEKYTECVRRNLYGSSQLHVGQRYSKRAVVSLLSQNDTLRSLAAMCVVRNRSQETESGDFAANPRIHDVITFNVDALLETMLKHKYAKGRATKDRVYRTIEKPAASSHHGRVNIYHVHGFLRFDRHKGEPDRESIKVVFSEQEYFDFFNSATSLFTYAFLSRLRESPCLFVGLSMGDDNLRRLLHYSKTERKESYTEEGDDEGTAEERSTRHYAILLNESKPDCKQAKETTLAALGTRVMWVNDFGKIRSILETLYESTEDNHWSDVYDDIEIA